jgi:hypothetical protein
MSKRTTKQVFQDLILLVESKGGRVLTQAKDYVNGKSKVRFMCEKRHEWTTTAIRIFSGRWCHICGGSFKLTLEEMQAIAISREGKCLSNEYHNAHTPLMWECKNRHQWLAAPDSVKHGSWCPECKTYISEEICRRYMEEIFGFPFPKIRPKWLLSPLQRPMELDGY